MSYRSILVYADAAAEAAGRFEIAAALAARSGAVLDGVFVRPPFLPPAIPFDVGGYVPPQTLQDLVEGHSQAVAEAEEAAQASFFQAVEQQGARAEWIALEETSGMGFVGLARCSDLVVFPKSGMTHHRLSPMDLAHDAAVPLVLTPTAPKRGPAARTVLLAWNGAREASSALRAAWPLLEQAEQVHVLMVDPPPEAEAFIGRQLRRHAVDAQIHLERSPDAKAGETIRSQAESLGADLVVMGLYGHSRVRELVLGGASRTMLDQDTWPLLISR